MTPRVTGIPTTEREGCSEDWVRRALRRAPSNVFAEGQSYTDTHGKCDLQTRPMAAQSLLTALIQPSHRTLL